MYLQDLDWMSTVFCLTMASHGHGLRQQMKKNCSLYGRIARRLILHVGLTLSIRFLLFHTHCQRGTKTDSVGLSRLF